MKKSDPAFPQHVKISDNRLETGLAGMSLRDYFAAKAMPDFMREFHKRHPEERFLYGDAEWIPRVASMCYEVADAMLEAREQ